MTPAQPFRTARTPARAAAAAVAGHEGDEPTARALLVDTEPSVRAAALGALGRMGALRPDDVCVALTDHSPVVRRRAVVLAIPHLEVALSPLLDDPDIGVVEQAAFALGERTPAEPGSVDALVGAATHPDPLVREAAVAALGSVGDPAGVAAVLAATTDKPAIRRRAVLALAAFAGDAVDAALRRALDDRDWQTRQSAATVLDARG